MSRRIGRGDFSEFAAARSDGAYETLAKVRRMRPKDIISAIEQSGERGRGGAAFPTGTKWRQIVLAISKLTSIPPS